jgi:hypothetical protein
MRTGIRSGIAPSDVWHIMGNGRVTLCGRVRVKAAMRIVPPATLEDVGRQVLSQGGTICEACASCRGIRMSSP